MGVLKLEKKKKNEKHSNTLSGYSISYILILILMAEDHVGLQVFFPIMRIHKSLFSLHL